MVEKARQHYNCMPKMQSITFTVDSSSNYNYISDHFSTHLIYLR